MTALWVLPLVVLAAGAVALALATSRLAGEAARLRPEVEGLRAVASEAAALRDESVAALHQGTEVADLRARSRALRAGR